MPHIVVMFLHKTLYMVVFGGKTMMLQVPR